MDLNLDKKVCGTCNDWKGKRGFEDGKCRVSPSARGLCERLKKSKSPHGGCSEWTKRETARQRNPRDLAGTSV